MPPEAGGQCEWFAGRYACGMQAGGGLQGVMPVVCRLRGCDAEGYFPGKINAVAQSKARLAFTPETACRIRKHPLPSVIIRTTSVKKRHKKRPDLVTRSFEIFNLLQAQNQL